MNSLVSIWYYSPFFFGYKITPLFATCCVCYSFGSWRFGSVFFSYLWKTIKYKAKYLVLVVRYSQNTMFHLSSIPGIFKYKQNSGTTIVKHKKVQIHLILDHIPSVSNVLPCLCRHEIHQFHHRRILYLQGLGCFAVHTEFRHQMHILVHDPRLL